MTFALPEGYVSVDLVEYNSMASSQCSMPLLCPKLSLRMLDIELEVLHGYSDLSTFFEDKGIPFCVRGTHVLHLQS